MPKKDRRGAARREISNATVVGGPYWAGTPAHRPATGGVFTPDELRSMAKSPVKMKSNDTRSNDVGAFPAFIRESGTWAERPW